MLQEADKECYKFAVELKDCYFGDNGCGISCLNSIAERAPPQGAAAA